MGWRSGSRRTHRRCWSLGWGEGETGRGQARGGHKGRLEGRLTADGTGWWHTATLYALPHAAAILAIGSLVESDPSSIVELDVNPLLLLADGRGVVAADALIALRER